MYIKESGLALMKGDKLAAEKAMRNGISFYTDKLTKEFGKIESDDAPIIIALLEIVAESFRGAAGETECRLADEIKSLIGGAVLKVPRAFIEGEQS